MTEQHDQDETHESWDSFWAEVQREPQIETIRGVEVKVPSDLPMRFDRRLDKLRGSRSEDDVKSLVAEIFGADVLDQWVEAGMTFVEFQTVMLWGMAHGKGRPITYREAYERATAQGKAPGSPTPKRKSGGTGGRSKPTSGASTGSRRTRSRT